MQLYTQDVNSSARCMELVCVPTDTGSARSSFSTRRRGTSQNVEAEPNKSYLSQRRRSTLDEKAVSRAGNSNADKKSSSQLVDQKQQQRRQSQLQRQRGDKLQNQDQQQQQRRQSQVQQQREDKLQNQAQQEYRDEQQLQSNIAAKKSQIFDYSPDGFIAAAAGAAIGAISGQCLSSRQGGISPADESRQAQQSAKWKVLGGAVLGAAAFNAAENQIDIYFEETEEKEDVREGCEFVGELVGAAGPDVM